MSHACTPILVGVTSLVLKILLLSKNSQISLSDRGLKSMGVKKFNHLELAQ